jgi:signal transduction histidine kinase/ActR/RegA family two-component response regulator
LKAPKPDRSNGRQSLLKAKLGKQLPARTRRPKESDAEVRELLAQQNATAEILRVISTAPADLHAVFDIIVANAARLCDANFAFVTLHQSHRLVLASQTACTPEFTRYLSSGLEVDRSTTSGRAAVERKAVQILDFLSDPEVAITEGHRAEPVRTVLAVPMLRGDALLGVIAIWRREVRPFTARQTRLLETFADQAVIAIENARLFDGIRDKTRELELANTFKSRFLAAASHDLRQPLHALNLFVAQLRARLEAGEHGTLIAQIDAAVNAMNELFNALLDMSKLEAGVLKPELGDFPVERVFKRIENTFAASAREKELRFSVVGSTAWIRSDFILVERILLNLVSNAVRYTTQGGVVVGCRRRGDRVRIDVIDSGPGIPEDQRQNVFGEFYRLAAEEQPRHRGGLGLGLSIVERLGKLLGHPIELASVIGRGSRFSVLLPQAERRELPADTAPAAAVVTSPSRGKLVLVIDDDTLVLEGMRGILESWGCDVTLAQSGTEALARLARLDRTPDLVISDYQLAEGESGIEAIEAVRRAVGSAVTAFLISGDTAPERLRDAAASNYLLLHKPVSPMALRAVLNRLFKAHKTAPAPR